MGNQRLKDIIESKEKARQEAVDRANEVTAELVDAQAEIQKLQTRIEALKKMVEIQSEIKREAVDVAVSLDKQVAEANKILEEKANEIITKVDEDGCPYEHRIGLTKTEQAIYNVLQNPRKENKEETT